MPRNWELRIEPWPELVAGRAYAARVASIAKSKKPPGIEIVFELVAPDQRGRRIEAVLPVPIHPGSPGAEFLRSCGMDVAVGRKLSPKDAVGIVINVRFAQVSNGDFEPIAFEPISKETEDG